MNKTHTRILQLQTALRQQDDEMAAMIATLLSDESDEKVVHIVQSIEGHAYEEAISLIEQYLELQEAASTQMVEYQDTELEELKRQLKELELAIESLSEQRDEQIELIQEFDRSLQLALGETVGKIHQLQVVIEQEKLRQKNERMEAAEKTFQESKAILESLKDKRQQIEETLEALDDLDEAYVEIEEALEQINEEIKAQQETVREKRKVFKEERERFEETNEESYEEAKKDYEEYQKSYEEVKSDPVVQLSKEDTALLKKLYRKAAKLCHPDTTADEFKEQATELMKQLNDAKGCGDIEAVEAILKRLETGVAFILSSDQLTGREQIEHKMAELVEKLDQIADEIEEISESETWILINQIDSWEAYFVSQIEELEAFAEQLEEEYQTLINAPAQKDAESERKAQAEKPISNSEDDYWSTEF